MHFDLEQIVFNIFGTSSPAVGNLFNIMDRMNCGITLAQVGGKK